MQAIDKTDTVAANTPTKPFPASLRYFAGFLIAAGLLTSVYLLNRYIHILSSGSHAKIDVCSAVFGKGCDSALTSPVSSLLGLPLAGWGVVFYASLILLICVPLLFGKAFKDIAGFFLSAFCFAGVSAAVILLSLMAISPKVFCPLCALIHTINIGLFIWLPRVAGFKRWQFFTGLKEITKNIFSKGGFSSAGLWKVFGILTILFFMAALFFGTRAVLAVSVSRKAPPPDFEKALKEYLSQSQVTIPADSTDPAVGNPESRIQVVIFSDFFCSGCKIFSLGLRKIIDSSQGQYHIRFKNFPLNKNCNPIVKSNAHQGACEAAMAAEAAGRQGKFWPFHDSLFAARKTADEAKLLQVAENIGLDMEWFNAYRRSDSAVNAVGNDVSMALRLGINTTPTIYLNGRLVADMRPVVLQFLINQEIKRFHAPPGSARQENP